MERKIKIILCIAIMCLIALISFVGVYTKDASVFKNAMPNYVLSSELSEKNVALLKTSEDTKEVIYDKDGNVVSEIPEGANEEDYKKEQEKVNKDELLTSENYKKAKKIMDNRLETMGVEDYLIRLDENTGNIALEIPNNLQSDETIQYLLYKGDFAITDEKDGTVLIDKSDVKEAKVLYSRATENGVTVYLDIIFNKEGKEKLARISKDYIKVEEENKENTENTENNENSEDTTNKEDNQKRVKLIIEGNTMLTTYFAEEMTTGELPISIGTGKDSSTLNDYAKQATVYSMLLNDETMPITYDVEQVKTESGNIASIGAYLIVGVILVVTIAITIYMVSKYKTDGVLAVISIVSFISLLMIIVRFTKTEISLNSIVAVIALMILDAYIICKMLKDIKSNSDYENISKATLNVYLKNIEVIAITLIIGIVFTFMQSSKVYSIGMMLFYGIISIGVINLVFLRTMLLAKYKNN